MPARFVLALGTLMILSAVESRGDAPGPTYWPTCESPQNIGLLQPIGGSVIFNKTAVVWNGLDFAMAWTNGQDQRLTFRRFFADGTPAGIAVRPSLTDAYYVDGPGLVWNGSGYGVAWSHWGGASPVVYFALLDANGAILGGETRTSFVGMAETVYSNRCALAWNGSTYCVVWDDSRSGNLDVYATLLNANGTIAGGGTLHDLPVATVTAGHQQFASVAWNPMAGSFQIVWQDGRSSPQQIYGRTLAATGGFGAEYPLTASTVEAAYPHVAAAPGGAAFVWRDRRDGNQEIYFARLSYTGSLFGLETRLTNNFTACEPPFLAWTGAEWGVFWPEWAGGLYDVWFTRVGSGGQVYGPLYQVTSTSGMFWPVAAFGRFGFMVSFMSGGGTGNFLEPWGCQWDYTPPSCPPNLLAYNVTGSTATVSWAPSVEDTSDIAYYQVYRNNIPLAKTSANFHTDTGLALGTTYNYFVRPVNAAQIENGACASSIYVKTNASLILTMAKSGDDAHLTWTDGGLNNYNVFRGASPQVMAQIGSTSQLQQDDPNVLLDGVAYFYTVDDPGW